MIYRAAVVALALACTGCVELSTKPARAPVMCNFGGQMVETKAFDSHHDIFDLVDAVSIAAPTLSEMGRGE